MASASRTQTELESATDVDGIVKTTLDALDNAGTATVFSGVEWFIDWIRGHLRDFFINRLSNLPIIGQWAGRISTTVSEFLLSVVQSTFSFLRIALESPALWNTVNAAAMRAWDANSDRGLLAQTYAYGRKMASCFLEILLQCFERAIRAKNLNVTAEEKKDISTILNGLIDKESV